MGEGFELPECYHDLSLAILAQSTKKKLQRLLDKTKEIVTDNGYTPDVLGLAELAGFDPTFVDYLESKEHKTQNLLDSWKLRRDGTLGNLLAHLTTLERYDCISDILPFLKRDIKNYEKSLTEAECDDLCGPETKKLNTGLNVEIPAKISRAPEVIHSPDVNVPDESLTIDDVHDGGLTKYTACVCCADEDLDIAHIIVEKYSEMGTGNKFFIPQDQLLPATYQYESIAEVIEDRCDGRLIVIMSRNYINSPACLFSTQFAKTLDPDARNRRIVPIIKDENVNGYPRILKGITALKLQRLKYGDAFWRLLAASLSVPYAATSNQNKAGYSTSSNSSSSSSSNNISCFSNSRSIENLSSGTSQNFSGESIPQTSLNICVSETSVLRMRSCSMESNESCTDNEEASINNSTHAYSNTSNNNNRQEQQQSMIVLPTREAYFNKPCMSEKSPESNKSGNCNEKNQDKDSGATGCSSCSQKTVKKSGKRVLTKLLKSLRLRKNVKKSNCSCQMYSSCASLPVMLGNAYTGSESELRIGRHTDSFSNNQVPEPGYINGNSTVFHSLP